MTKTRNRLIARNPRATLKAKATLPSCDKWIIGMVEKGTIEFFIHPTVHLSYDAALTTAKNLCDTYNKPFVVFAKQAVIAPAREPIIVTEFII